MTNLLTQGPGPIQGPGDVTAALAKAHDMAKGLFDTTSKAMQKFNLMQTELGKLVKLGDMVTVDDVVKGAAALVGEGAFGPREMAVVLTDMPQGGQALANWLQVKLAKASAALAQTTQTHAVARHEMGASGLRLLGHIAQGGGPGPAPLATGSTTTIEPGISLQAGGPSNAS